MTLPCRTTFATRFVLIVLLGTWAYTPSDCAAEPLPSQISDETFWQMISDFSEEGGDFRSENFLSNDLLFQFVLPPLKEIAKPGGVYIGVGPDQNLKKKD